MAYEKIHTNTTFINDSPPPLDADQCNSWDNDIDTLDDRVVAIDGRLETVEDSIEAGLNINDINDVAIASATDGQVMTYDSETGKWVNEDLPDYPVAEVGSLGMVKPDGTTVTISSDGTIHSVGAGGGTALSALNDVDLSNVQDGQSLVYDATSSKWVNGSGGIDDTQISTETTWSSSKINQKLTDIVLINVSTSDTSLVGETVTLKLNGTTVASGTFDAEGKAGLFCRDLGTYVIECGEYSTQVIVTEQFASYSAVISTSTEITLTVEGAKEDNITILDSNGTTVATVIIPSGATSAQVTLDIQDGDTYTFRSANIDAPYGNLGKFEKDVVLTNASTNVKVMMEGALYWEGHSVEQINNWSHSGFQTGVSYQFSDTSNAKKVTMTGQGFGGFCGNNAVDMTNIERVCAKLQMTPEPFASDSSQNIALSDNKLQNVAMPTWTIDRFQTSDTNGIYSLDVSGVSTTAYISACWHRASEAYMHSLWLESIRSVPSPSQTVTLTVEGAMEDKITVYDRSWNVVAYVDFASGQTSASATLNIKSGGEKLIFASSVSNYAKEVLVTSATTTVKVMPDGYMLYWYGNEFASNSGGWSTSGWGEGSYVIDSAFTKNTNNMSATIPSSNMHCVMIGTQSEFPSGYTKIRAMFTTWEGKKNVNRNISQSKYVTAWCFRSTSDYGRMYAPNIKSTSTGQNYMMDGSETSHDASHTMSVEAVWLE